MTVAGVSVIAVLVAWVIYFFFFKANDYTCSLPANAQAMVRLDVRSLKENGTAPFIGDKGKQMEQCGIDFTQPLYAFVDGSNCPGSLLPLRDAKRWQEYLKNRGIEIQRQRGYRWAQSGQWLMAFSDDRCLVLGPLSEQEMGRMRGRMITLMKQKGKQDNALLLPLAKSEAPLCAVLSTRLVRQLSERFLPETAALWSNEQEGTVTMEAFMQEKCIHASVSLQATGLEHEAPLFTPLSAADVPGLGSDRMASVSIGVNGNELLKTLRKNPAIRTGLIALNFCLDLDMMIRSVSGAVTLSIPCADDVLPGALLTARLQDTRFMQDRDDWAKGLSAGFGVELTALADSAYQLQWQDYSICFGVQENRLTACMDKPTFLQAFRKDEQTPVSHAREADGSIMYVQVNLPAMLEKTAFLTLLTGGGESLTDFLAQYETLTVSVRTNCQGIPETE